MEATKKTGRISNSCSRWQCEQERMSIWTFFNIFTCSTLEHLAFTAKWERLNCLFNRKGEATFLKGKTINSAASFLMGKFEKTLDLIFFFLFSPESSCNWCLMCLMLSTLGEGKDVQPVNEGTWARNISSSWVLVPILFGRLVAKKLSEKEELV